MTELLERASPRAAPAAPAAPAATEMRSSLRLPFMKRRSRPMTLVIKNSDHLCSALQLLQSLSHSESHSQSVRGGVINELQSFNLHSFRKGRSTSAQPAGRMP